MTCARSWPAAPDGQELARAPAGRERVPGYDLTFSAPKSVSLLHALGNTRLQYLVVAAHEDAVAAALDYLEREAALLRRGHGGREQVAAQGLVAAAFRHRVSRALDPALHTHVLVANLARSADGRSGALDGRALYRHQTTAGYLYQAELRHRLAHGSAWSGARCAGAWPTLRASRARWCAPSAAGAPRSRRRWRHGAPTAAAPPRWPRSHPRGQGGRALPHHLLPEWQARAEELGFGPRELGGVLDRTPAPERESGSWSILAELAGPRA